MVLHVDRRGAHEDPHVRGGSLARTQHVEELRERLAVKAHPQAHAVAGGQHELEGRRGLARRPGRAHRHEFHEVDRRRRCPLRQRLPAPPGPVLPDFPAPKRQRPRVDAFLPGESLGRQATPRPAPNPPRPRRSALASHRCHPMYAGLQGVSATRFTERIRPARLLHKLGLPLQGHRSRTWQVSDAVDGPVERRWDAEHARERGRRG